MIPYTVNKLNNEPKRKYQIVEENGDINVYYKGIFVYIISVSNFFNLLKTTTFSKGVAFSNFLLFIEDKNKNIILVNKNSKEHFNAMKEHIKIKDIKRLTKISFISNNEYNEGYYLGLAKVKHTFGIKNKAIHAIEVNKDILLSSDINTISILGKDNKYNPDFSKTFKIKKYGREYFLNDFEVELFLEKEIEKNKQQKELNNFLNNQEDIADMPLTSVSIYNLNKGDIFFRKKRLSVLLGKVKPKNKMESYYAFLDIKRQHIFLSYSSFNVLSPLVNYSMYNMLIKKKTPVLIMGRGEHKEKFTMASDQEYLLENIR